MKEKTIVFDTVISVQDFYRAFYRHIESTSFAADKGRNRCYWYGEAHSDGTFEAGCHYPEFNRRGFGGPHLPHQIKGKLTNENGKTKISYAEIWSSNLLIILIFSAFLVSVCMPNIFVGDWITLLPFLVFGGIFVSYLFWGTTAYRKFPKMLENIVKDAKTPPKEDV